MTSSEEPKPERTRVYVCGHRNPDTDSIAAAIGYAELKNHLDEDRKYVPVRLGVANAQTSWLIERSGAPLPVFLPHAKLRVRDVMRKQFPIAERSDPVRTVGLMMAPQGHRADRRRRGRAAGRANRAGARAPLHPRVARGLAPGRADAGRHDRRRARGSALVR